MKEMLEEREGECEEMQCQCIHSLFYRYTTRSFRCKKRMLKHEYKHIDAVAEHTTQTHTQMHWTEAHTFRLYIYDICAVAIAVVVVSVALEEVIEEMQEVALQMSAVHEDEVVETAPETVGVGLQLQLGPQVRLHKQARGVGE